MAYIAGTFFAGLLGGFFFFGGLRYSVGKMLTSAYGWLWALGGFVIRMVGCLALLYFSAGSDAVRWLAGLAGMMVARTLILRFTKAMEVCHAAKS
ncbi:MAG TPA: ATP synthase subunit I [Puia sp.]|nr:ATP synthase subunit I [Puia sp.]